MILFYVRHGDPIYDPDQLTPLGQRQAESVAKRLAVFGVDEVYASTSTRAIQTAAPTCEILKKEPVLLDWMHEDLSIADLAVKTPSGKNTWIWAHSYYSQLLASKKVKEMGDKWYTHPEFSCFNAKNAIDRIGQNLDKWLAGMGLEHDREKGMYKITADVKNKRIALFAHEGAGKLFMSELLDVSFPNYASHFDMKHTGITAICFDEGYWESYGGYARARVMTLSNDSHLFRDGLPLNHVSAALREKY